MVVRNAVGIPIVFIMAVLFGPDLLVQDIHDVVWLLITIGVVQFGISKILWIKSLSFISITEATAVHSLDPVFTIFIAWIILGEYLTFLQVVGCIALIVGGLIIVYQKRICV